MRNIPTHCRYKELLECHKHANANAPSACRELLDAVMRLRPKLHVFGHVHGAHAILQTNQTTFVNAALLDSNGDLNQGPVLVRMVTI